MSTEPTRYLGDPNPAVSITIQFQDGAEMRWLFQKPWDQAEMFFAFGRLGSEHQLGIDFDLGDVNVEDRQYRAMDLEPEEDDEHGGVIMPRAAPDQEEGGE